MNKEFIDYKSALSLKELGFDEECMAVYFVPTKGLHYGATKNLITNYTEDVRTAAPLYQQAFRWFREKYKLMMHIQRHSNNKYLACMGIQVEILCDTYEEAELACLKKLIEIAKNK